jgi:hypothetical protein
VTYLGLEDGLLTTGSDLMFTYSPAIQSLIVIGRWFLILQCFVSISLLVSLEMVKFFQGTFMEYDWMMYDEEKDMPMKV